MVNLVTPSAVKSLRQRYLLRLVTVTSGTLALVLLIGGLLLVPSYFLSEATAEAGEEYLAALEDIVGLRERAGVSATVGAAIERMRIMDQYAAEPLFGPVVTALGESVPSDVIVTSFVVDPGEAGTSVTVSGIATSRTSLLTFAEALKEVPVFSGVSLPVGVLAADEDIPFTLGFSYAPRP